MNVELRGKVALVTGASRGIGRAVSLARAESGCNLAINYCRDERSAVEVRGTAEELGVNAREFRADVADRRQVLGWCVFGRLLGYDEASLATLGWGGPRKRL